MGGVRLTRHLSLAWWLASGFIWSGVSLSAADVYYTPPLERLAAVGSAPAANKMDARQHDAWTQRWRQRYQQHRFAPDYSSSAEMLSPPRQQRLPTPLALARAGKALATIVVDLSPALHTPEVTLGRADYPMEVAEYARTGHVVMGHAARELKLWLDTLTGADFPVVGKPGGAAAHIYLGANFAKQRYAADLAKLAAGEALDGFAVRVAGNAVYIFGATAKGTLNGVYAFIENNSDLIWAHSFSDLGTVYTVNPDLKVVWSGGLEVPGTIQRGWNGHYKEENGAPAPAWMWQMRNRANYIVAPSPSPKIADWGGWREAGGHCLATAAPQRGQDFFPVIRDPKSGALAKPAKIQHYHHNLCLTHPDLPDLYAAKIVADIRKENARYPDRPLGAFRLGIEDPGPEKEYGVCNCARCLLPIRLPSGQIVPYQNAAKEGLAFRSTQLYLLLEPIARAVAREFPGMRLSTYAYYFAVEPPPFQTSVQPWFCPYGGGGQLVHRDYLHPLFWETNAKWWGYLYGWSRQTDLTVMRDYHGLLTNGRPFADVLAWEVRAMREMGVRRFSNETALNTAFLQMDFWVANRIYWNPDADVEQLRKYYLRRVFREGAPEMERFFGEIRGWLYAESGLKREDFINLGWIVGRMGQRDKLYASLKKAEAMARHPVARANVTRLRKTFAIWFNLDRDVATADAMLANAKLGRHLRYSSFAHRGEPLPVSYVTIANGKPLASANLFAPDDLRAADFSGWTFSLRLRPLAAAAAQGFVPPRLSPGNDVAYMLPTLAAQAAAPGAALAQLDGDADSYWGPDIAAEPQPDGSFLYKLRLEKAPGWPFVPAKFARIRLAYPKGAAAAPPGGRVELAIYDMRLTDTKGGRYVMPSLAQQRGNKATARYFEGGEMGD